MATPRLVLLAALAPFLIVLPAAAQDLGVSESAVRSEVAETLPDWWQLNTFEIVGVGSDIIAPAPSGKVPGPAVTNGGNEGGKPDASPMAGQTAAFNASLRLVEEIYEPLYSLDGTAIVRPIMEGGFEIDITGSVGISGDGDAAEFGVVHFDQGGVMELGRPLEAFDLPALVEGSDEAAAFLAERDAARAEGTLGKMMGDTGEEL